VGRAVVGGAEQIVPRRHGLLDLAGGDDAIRVIVGGENGVRRAANELIVCVHRQDPTDAPERLAVAFLGRGVGSAQDLLEVRETGRLGVGPALVGDILGCATPDGGGLRLRERADETGTDVVDGGDAICLADGFRAVAVVRINDRFTGG